MTSKYKARWESAVKLHTKFNELLDQGWVIFDEDDNRVSKFVITDEEIMMDEGDRCYQGYFTNDREMYDGLYMTVKEYRSQFKDWKFIEPSKVFSFDDMKI